MKQCLILCASDIGNTAVPEDFSEGCFVICADGGQRHLSKLHLKPDLIVGDFDSGNVPENAPCEVIRLPAEKDVTDTFFAAEEGIRRGCTDFLLLGATGGRLDHTMANLSLLWHLSEQGFSARLLDEGNEAFILKEGSTVLKKGRYRYFSLFAYEREAFGVTLEGARYPLADARLCSTFPLGVSNEFLGEKASVKVARGPLLIILSRG